MHQADFLVTSQTMTLDIAGPMDVFVTANRFLDSGAMPYHNRVIGLEMGAVPMSGGGRLLVDEVIRPETAGDTLVVAGGDNTAILEFAGNPRVHEFLRGAVSKYRRIVSICNGALILAHAGLLAGRRATTHWEDLGLLRDIAPDAEVADDVLYVRDGDIFTSAGVSAGIDLALHIVELDHGRTVALKTARQLVVYLRRPGGQKQFSDLLHAEFSAERFANFNEWLQENLSQKLTLDDMAEAVGMSRRNFTRQFRESTGGTPSEHVERLRVETASNLLTGSVLSLKQIARKAGFGSEQGFRRVFMKHYGLPPAEYRKRFGGDDNA